MTRPFRLLKSTFVLRIILECQSSRLVWKVIKAQPRLKREGREALGSERFSHIGIDSSARVFEVSGIACLNCLYVPPAQPVRAPKEPDFHARHFAVDAIESLAIRVRILDLHHISQAALRRPFDVDISVRRGE
jgi:hypothetical protein